MYYSYQVWLFVHQSLLNHFADKLNHNIQQFIIIYLYVFTPKVCSETCLAIVKKD